MKRILLALAFLVLAFVPASAVCSITNSYPFRDSLLNSQSFGATVLSDCRVVPLHQLVDQTGTPYSGSYGLPVAQQGTWAFGLTGPIPAGTNSIGTVAVSNFPVAGTSTITPDYSQPQNALGPIAVGNPLDVKTPVSPPIAWTASGNGTIASTLIDTASFGYHTALFTVPLSSATASITPYATNDQNLVFDSYHPVNCKRDNDHAKSQSQGYTNAAQVCNLTGYRWFVLSVSNYTSGTITGSLSFAREPSPLFGPGDFPADAVATGQAPYTSNQTPLSATSGNVANAAAIATFAGVSGKTNYITGIELTAGGATAAGCVTVTLSGTLGVTTNHTFCAPAGAGSGALPLLINFNPPLAATGQAAAVVLTLPALGAGNTNATATMHGYYQ